MRAGSKNIIPHYTSATFRHCTTYNCPKADISRFKIIDQDRKQVSKEARKAIHTRRNDPALNHNIPVMRLCLDMKIMLDVVLVLLYCLVCDNECPFITTACV